MRLRDRQTDSLEPNRGRGREASARWHSLPLLFERHAGNGALLSLPHLRGRICMRLVNDNGQGRNSIFSREKVLGGNGAPAIGCL